MTIEVTNTPAIADYVLEMLVKLRVSKGLCPLYPVELVEEALEKGTTHINPDYPNQIQYFLKYASSKYGALNVAVQNNYWIRTFKWYPGNEVPKDWY